MKLLDTRFHRSGYPKTVNYTENDMPDRWPATWTRRGAYDTDFYIEQTHRQFTYTLNSQGCLLTVFINTISIILNNKL